MQTQRETLGNAKVLNVNPKPQFTYTFKFTLFYHAMPCFCFVSADKNECEEIPSRCPKDSPCKNTIGSFECICKNKGYSYKAGRCLDINECVQQPGPCDNSTMICQNSQGSYTCECKPHYKRAGNVCKGGRSLHALQTYWRYKILCGIFARFAGLWH